MVKNLADFEELKAKIYTLRGTKVILDRDLAALYDVETRALNQSVKRNPERFPNDFMFQLTRFEWESVRSQFVISHNNGKGYLPYAFTEQGVAMLSSVLKSKIAAAINIRIMRAFVEIRNAIAVNPEYEHLKETVRRIESQMEAMSTNSMVDGILVEKKLVSMSIDIRRISETLDSFQDGYIVIKRPEQGLHEG